MHRFNSIDITKMVMAALVVAIHVGCMQSYTYGENVWFMLCCAVPFFFVASGFLIENRMLKLEYDNNRGGYLVKNVKRNAKLYLLYMSLWIPADLHWCITNSNPWYYDLAWYIKGVFIMGETRYSIPLWFLMALIVAEMMVVFFYKVKIHNLYKIWAIGISVMLIGYLMEFSTNTLLSLFSKHVGYRNGLFMGLGLFTSGMLIRRLYERMKRKECFLCGTLQLVCAYFMFKYNLPFKYIFAGCGALMLSLSIPLKDHWFYASLRNISTLVYFLHMYIIVAATLLFSDVFKEMSIMQLWLIILSITILLSAVIENVRKRSEFAWLNNLIG